FRDYLYIPLGGNRGSRAFWFRNLMIVFVVSGLWHGANWTFVVWGAVHAALFLPLLLTDRNRAYTTNIAPGRMLPRVGEAFQMLITFSLVALTWIFFRAESIGAAGQYLAAVFTPALLAWPQVLPADTVALVAAFLAVEWIGREQSYAIANLGFHWPRPVRLALYYGLCLAIVSVGGDQQTFIYFQF
ncbi:MAG: hypothetical protein KDA89_22455, partial [Planctomycetaceae bacterium]|nr:hypothetical protein [Planctomycetaceae bacterium]